MTSFSYYTAKALPVVYLIKQAISENPTDGTGALFYSGQDASERRGIIFYIKASVRVERFSGEIVADDKLILAAHDLLYRGHDLPRQRVGLSKLEKSECILAEIHLFEHKSVPGMVEFKLDITLAVAALYHESCNGKAMHTAKVWESRNVSVELALGFIGYFTVRNLTLREQLLYFREIHRMSFVLLDLCKRGDILGCLFY